MSSEKTLINKLKKIEDNRFEDHASQLLFYYCKGVNSFHHRLGKGLDIPLAQKGKSGNLIMTHDTDMCVYIDNAFHKVDRESDLALPKKEHFHNLNISSYNNFLEKHSDPNDFEIDNNYVEDEIYHYSVEDNDLRNYTTSIIGETKWHLMSVSLIYIAPYITMLVQEGTDMKEWVRNLEEFQDIDSDDKWRNIKDSWVDREGAKRELFTRTSLARFDWNKLSKVLPNEEKQAYHESTNWYQTRYSHSEYWVPDDVDPQTHLKRWVWLPKFLNANKADQNK